MDYLLNYAKTLRLTPKGNRITATQKLALLVLIIEGNGGETVFNAVSLAEVCLLGTTRSAYRLIDALEAEGLLAVFPQRDAKGHKLDSLVYPLPEIARLPTDIQVSKTLNPTDIQVSRQNPTDIQSRFFVNRLNPTDIQDSRQNEGNSNNKNSLQENDFGTKVALNTPPPNIYIKREGEQNPTDIQDSRKPAVIIWFEETGQGEITARAANLIATKVFNLPVWRETLTGYMANPRWSATNIDAQIERYFKKLKTLGAENSTPLETSSNGEETPLSAAEIENRRKIKEIAYGNDD